MGAMLTQEDLKAIGQVVEDKIEEALVDTVNKGFENVQEQLDGVKTRLTGVETRLTGVETRLTGVEATMATKDFVERRLAKTDGKINALINVLEKKRVITEGEKSAVLL